MSQKQPIPSIELFEEAQNQVSHTTPDKIISIIANQISVANEARQRITEEGIVVRDIKGSVLAHPAIKIETDAQKIICDLITKHKKTKREFDLGL